MLDEIFAEVPDTEDRVQWPSSQLSEGSWWQRDTGSEEMLEINGVIFWEIALVIAHLRFQIPCTLSNERFCCFNSTSSTPRAWLLELFW